MKLINGLLNYSVPWTLPDMYLFTGNSTVKQNGAIVMGKGAAKHVRDAYPGIDKVFGNMLQHNPGAHILLANLDQQYIGWFKVKEHWAHAASLELIKVSTEELKDSANERSHLTIHMNFPGVGNGQLSIENVLPIVEQLPDNVLLYR
jgi:hypothetical protein